MIHAKLLFHLGCTLLQGYAIAKPMPTENLIPWLQHWTFNPEWKKYRFSRQDIDAAITLVIQDSDRFKSIRHLAASNTFDSLDSNIDTCQLEQWLIDHQHQFKDQKTFNRLHHLHQKGHDLVLQIMMSTKTADKASTQRTLKSLDTLRHHLVNAMMIGIFE